MTKLISAATLNGCRFAQNQQHGCSSRDRINLLRIILILFVVLSLNTFAAETAVDRSNIGEITAFSGRGEVVHSSASINEGMQVGGKIYPMDTIKTGSGSVEMVFGINSRVVLGSDTSVVVESVNQKSEIKSHQLYSTSQYTLVLKKGVVRVRVRENFITSTIISIIAGDVKITAPRSDLVVSRDNYSNRPSYVGIIIAWGRANVNKKNVNDLEWNPANDKVAVEGFNSLIEERDIADKGIKWEKIGIDEAHNAVRELPFSIDNNTSGFGDIPERLPALQGA